MSAGRVRCCLPLILGLAFACAAGCVHVPTTVGEGDERSQRDQDLDIGLIGDVTEVGNVAPVQIHGVGLVSGLDGTGDSPPGMYRTMLEDELRKRKVENVKQLLDSPNHALVVVTAHIPAGARKGDRLDVQVTLPEGSKTTSLQGGYLHACVLRNYESAQNISQAAGNSLLQGHILGHASGPLLVGFGNPKDPAEVRRGRIWDGGVSHIDRPFVLVLKNDSKFARVANNVAERINLLYHESNQERARILQHKRLLVLSEMTGKINDQYSGAGFNQTMAKALNKDAVLINVPHEYRLNPARFLRVARLTPLQNLGPETASYKELLGEMLLEPAETMRAALRLEAMGKETVPILEKGLKSDHALVRFSAAEALAYLGHTGGCDELAELAQDFPLLTAHCLLALAGLDEVVCRARLDDLLAHANIELRCGAFQARRLMNELRNRENQEDKVFSLHQVARESPQLVYFSISNRAEVVLFGEPVALTPPLKILAAPNFSVIAAGEDRNCIITRYRHSRGTFDRKICSLHLPDILRTMVEMGGTYADAVEFLRQADAAGCLPCPVNANALPEMVPVEVLAERAGDPDFLRKRIREAEFLTRD